MIERLHAFISGKVQGVYFRETTRRCADALHLHGWVRNLEDGRVEALAEGDRVVLDEFLTFLHRGPEAAHVTAVEHVFEKATGEFADFKIHAS